MSPSFSSAEEIADESPHPASILEAAINATSRYFCVDENLSNCF